MRSAVAFSVLLFAATLAGCEAPAVFSGLSRECRAQVADFNGYANCMALRVSSSTDCLQSPAHCQYILRNISVVHAAVSGGEITPRQGVEHVERVASSAETHIANERFRQGMIAMDQQFQQQQQYNLQQQQIWSQQRPQIQNCTVSPNGLGGWRSTCY